MIPTDYHGDVCAEQELYGRCMLVLRRSVETAVDTKDKLPMRLHEALNIGVAIESLNHRQQFGAIFGSPGFLVYL